MASSVPILSYLCTALLRVVFCNIWFIISNVFMSMWCLLGQTFVAISLVSCSACAFHVAAAPDVAISISDITTKDNERLMGETVPRCLIEHCYHCIALFFFSSFYQAQPKVFLLSQQAN